MAYNQLKTVKLACVDAWAEIMPNDPVSGQAIPVGYAWPGTWQQRAASVWTSGGRTTYLENSLKAGRRFRRVETTFQVVSEVYLTGRTLDESGANVLQQEADDLIEQITGTIDEWIADNPKLGFTNTAGAIFIDWATFASVTLEHGPTENGVAARHVCDITYHARLR
jgi:hypothetical protein